MTFFKTGPGQYGEGDKFLGITTPVLRNFAKNHQDLSIPETLQLLHSEWHEERALALVIWMLQFKKFPEKRGAIYNAYLKNTKHINNWDLVDISAPHLVGAYLHNAVAPGKMKKPAVLYTLARSKSLWDRRIGIISTLHFIRKKNFEDTLRISEMLLEDEEDLIHKAVGWLIREVGKRNQPEAEKFLKKYHRAMPRTMLRYAIEKFSKEKRAYYMKR